MTDQALKAYLQKIRSIPLLTADQERDLAKRIENGDEEAKDLLIKHNLRLVASLASRNRGWRIPYEDRIGAGNIGLCEAAERFDWRRGNRFITFATPWITRRIKEAISKVRVVTVTDYGNKRLLKFRSIREQLTQEIGDKPPPEILAFAMNTTLREIGELMALEKDERILNEVKRDRNGNEIGEGIDLLPENPACRQRPAPDIFPSLLEQFLETLNERERFIFSLRYPCDAKEGLNCEEIALGVYETFGQVLGEKRIYQVLKDSRNKLKEFLKNSGNN